MQRILLYEHLTATYAPEEGNGSWQTEGRGMIAQMARDVAHIDGLTASVVLHPRQPCLDAKVQRRPLAGDPVDEPHARLKQTVEDEAPDAVLVIAPEMNDLLATLSEAVESTSVRSLGPPSAFIRAWGNKMAPRERLGERALPTIITSDATFAKDDWERWSVGGGDSDRRIVIKPGDGAGSLYTAICPLGEADTVTREIRRQGYLGRLVAQPYWPGLAASIAVVAADRNRPVFLPAAEQRLEFWPILPPRGLSARKRASEWIAYAGGSLPLEPPLTERATVLAKEVIEAGPKTRGYIGIDLVLGEDADGRDDRVIEVNPRLTTSFTGYSALLGPRLMETIVLGRSEPLRRALADAARRPFVSYSPDGGTQWSEEESARL